MIPPGDLVKMQILIQQFKNEAKRQLAKKYPGDAEVAGLWLRCSEELAYRY